MKKITRMLVLNLILFIITIVTSISVVAVTDVSRGVNTEITFTPTDIRPPQNRGIWREEFVTYVSWLCSQHPGPFPHFKNKIPKVELEITKNNGSKETHTRTSWGGLQVTYNLSSRPQKVKLEVKEYPAMKRLKDKVGATTSTSTSTATVYTAGYNRLIKKRTIKAENATNSALAYVLAETANNIRTTS